MLGRRPSYLTNFITHINCNYFSDVISGSQRGDLAGVEELVLGLTDKGDINRYANILFDCVDTGRQRIAVYLIRQGMRTDIYKQVVVVTSWTKQFLIIDSALNKRTRLCNTTLLMHLH